MNELVLPVPKTVLATYIVPVPTPMSAVEARQQASRAVEAKLTGPLRTLTAQWLAKGKVKVAVEAAGPPPPALLDTVQVPGSTSSVRHRRSCTGCAVNTAGR